MKILKNEQSFTLIELVIVIGILAILAVVVILAINPSEFLKQSRDSQRLSELQSINKAIGLYQADGKTSFGSSSVVYVSIPDSSDTCANLGLPSLPTGWEYRCSNSDNYRKVDNTGWVPVPFTSVSYGAPLNILPIDSINTTSTGNYYTYVVGGFWKLTSLFESEKYAKNMTKDGGPDPGIYEVGTNLNLANFARGLVGYWKFDEGSGTTANDSSGYGNNGTAYSSSTPSATWTSGKVAGALSFDGSNYVRVLDNPSLDITGDITIEVWAKFTDLAAKQSVISKKEGWASYTLRINQDAIDQRLCFFVEGGDASKLYKVFSTTQVESNKWYHIVGTREGSSLKIYINGVLENSASAPEMAANDYDLFIGGDPKGSPPGTLNYPFTGIIDEPRIYNRALSAAEIAAIYNATK